MKEVLIPHSSLRTFYKALFTKIGVNNSISSIVVDGLIDTSLRGVDSHGIRLIPHYIHAVNLERINKKAQFSFEKTSSTTGIINADHGFGIAAGVTAMNKAISMAKKSGMGGVAVKNSSHFGAAAIYSLLAANNNMIGLSFTHTDSLVVPFSGKKPFLGTNPICFAAPCEREEPFCLDMATSQISWNKLLLYRSKGKKLENGWAVDDQGASTKNPNSANALLPIGKYKGYGLGLMIEILCSLLTGMPFGKHIKSMYPLDKNKRLLGHFFMAIDIGRFQDVGVFRHRMKMLVDELRRESPARGFKKVMVAGDPEKENYRLRSKTGIPVGKMELNELVDLAQELNLERDYLKFLGSYFKGMLFDYDGVLADTFEDNFRAWCKAFVQYGVKVTKNEYVPLEGLVTYQKAERIGNKHGVDRKYFSDIVDLKEKLYKENNDLKLYGGVESIVKKLKSKDIKLGLVSSISGVRMRSTTPKELLSLFDVVVTADMVSHAKPNPEPYNKALKLLDIRSSEAIAVEDTPIGIQAAKSAGIYCIAVGSTVKKKYLLKADAVINQFEDLRGLLSYFLK